MSAVEDFIATPSLESLDKWSREQLLQVAEHFSVVVVGDKRLKENIRNAIKTELIGSGLMSSDKPVFPPCPTTSSFQTLGLTFEQQREMFISQLEH